MGLYSGRSCAVCDSVFTDNDDIVVCPVCGAPHHRECFAKAGGCRYESLHESGFMWDGASVASSGEHILNNAANEPASGQESFDAADARPTLAGYKDEIYNRDNDASIHSTINPNTSEAISNDEYAAYIGPFSFYFLRQFKILEDSSKVFSWNWSAFFWESLYFFYRKMYGFGAIIMLLTAFFNLPGVLINLETAFIEHPELFKSAIGYSEQTMKMLETLSIVGTVLYFICRIGCAFLANRIYKEKVERDIEELRVQFSSKIAGADYFAALQDRGGPSLISVLLALFVQFTVISSLSRIIL
jgi:hypothetical protein